MSPLTKLKAFMNSSESGPSTALDDILGTKPPQTGFKPQIVLGATSEQDKSANAETDSPKSVSSELNSKERDSTKSTDTISADTKSREKPEKTQDKAAPLASPAKHSPAQHSPTQHIPTTEPDSMKSLHEQNSNQATASKQTHIADTSAPRELGPTRRTSNLSNIRTDLAQLNDDMSSGEQFYAQSLKRINNLISYAYETEANLSALELLEPENARLKEELDDASKRANDEALRAESFKAKAETYETRYVDARQSLENAQLSLTKLETERDTLERKLSDTEVEIAGLTNSNRTIRNELDIDRQSHEKLSAKNLSLSSELSVALSEKLELEKRYLDGAGRLEGLAAEKIELERMLAQTRSLHRATEEHNVSLKAEMEQVLADVKVFKQKFDSSSQNHTTELNSLRAKLADLQTEIRIKEDVVEHSRQETTELRAQYEASNRGRKNLMSHIEDQKKTLEALHNSEQRAKETAESSNSKIITLQAEIDQLRRVNSAQSEKLKKYMAITATPVSAATSLASPSSSINTSQNLNKTVSSLIDDVIRPISASPAPASSAVPAVQEPLESRARRRAERQAREEKIEASSDKSSPETEKTSSSSPNMAEFDRQFDDLETAAAPTSPSVVPSANSNQSSDEALNRFHEIDLLGKPSL